MRSSSQLHASSRSTSRKTKIESQREYRSKEMDGFSELRDALLLVDSFDTPLGRDATRYQLLITAAKKLRNLADENQKLVLRLGSEIPDAKPHEAETEIPRRPTAHVDVAWATQDLDVEYLLSMAAQFVPPLRRDYEPENATPEWVQGRLLFQGHGHQPHDMELGLSYQGLPAVKDVWRCH